MNDVSTKERIIKAVLTLIGQKEIGTISTREILTKSEVSNLSAINYYFGSKENLINIAMEHYYKEMFHIFQKMDADEGEPRNAIIQFCLDFTEYIKRYPGLEKNILMKVISENKNTVISNVMKRNIDVISRKIKISSKIKNKKILMYKTILLLSGLVYPFLLGHYDFDITGLKCDDTDTKNEYFHFLVDSIV